MAKNWIGAWKVIPVAGVAFDEYRLYRAMKAASPPGCMEFILDRDGEYERQHLAWGGPDYGHWPVPKLAGSVCVFNPAHPDYDARLASGFGWLNDDVASCTYRPREESDLIIGNRIWHEILHCMTGTIEPDQMCETPEFLEYLDREFGEDAKWVVQFRKNPRLYEHDPAYQKAFYRHLVEKHFWDEIQSPAIPVPILYRLRDAVETLLSLLWPNGSLRR